MKRQLADMVEVLVVCMFGVGLFGGLQRGLVWAGIGWGAKPFAGLVTMLVLLVLIGTWARRQNEERMHKQRERCEHLPRHDA